MTVRNPQKNYNFELQVVGLGSIAIQSVTPPPVEFTEHKQGSSGNKPDKKTPGKKIVGDLVAEVLVDGLVGDPVLWARFEACETELREVYVGTGILMEKGPGNIAPVNQWFIGEFWFKKIETSNYDKRGDNSADTVRTVTLSVEDYRKI